jgi:hypothetical protein
MIHYPVAGPDAYWGRSDLRGRRALGMPGGRFAHPTHAPLAQPPAWLERERAAAGLAPEDFDVMKIGETRRIVPASK